MIFFLVWGFLEHLGINGRQWRTALHMGSKNTWNLTSGRVMAVLRAVPRKVVRRNGEERRSLRERIQPDIAQKQKRPGN